jgi:hypothetical protein
MLHLTTSVLYPLIRHSAGSRPCRSAVGPYPPVSGASRTMLDRTAERFGLTPKRMIADSAYGRHIILPGWSRSAGSSHTVHS